MESAPTRDIIVVGSSSGGIEALSMLARGLPEDLPAAVFVVQHVSADSPALLASILTARGPLPAVTAEDGMSWETGRIHVAPPDRHLLLTGSGIRVVFGARENRSRPAIDPLFRTAAVHHRSRVIGVILTGSLGDGAAGLLAVRRCGGEAVVQAPDDAAHPEMPARALAVVPNARRVPLHGLAALLGELAGRPVPEPGPVPDVLRLEAHLTERAERPMPDDDWSELPSGPTDFTCPECRGTIREIDDPELRRFRCRVGHAFSSESMVEAGGEGLENALWIALQTLQERVQMLETMADDDRERGRDRSAESFEERAREARAHVASLRAVLARIGAAPRASYGDASSAHRLAPIGIHGGGA